MILPTVNIGVNNVYYINMKHNDENWRGVETVDEFETRSEANEMLPEYIMAFNGADLYISSRCTREWAQ